LSDKRDRLIGLPTTQLEDLAFLICGKAIGSGMSRNVFEYRLSDKWVAKLEHNSTFQNQVEWEIWNEVKDHKALSRWFAPCIQISGYGQWLIQARTFPIEKRSLPSKVPHIFTDLKIGNWGWLDGRPVCHDYGTMLCRLFGKHAERLRKADWWQ
jgi:hypothetical protein